MSLPDIFPPGNEDIPSWGDWASDSGDAEDVETRSHVLAAWCPFLGPTGDTLIDIGPQELHGTPLNENPPTWIERELGWSTEHNDTDNDTIWEMPDIPILDVTKPFMIDCVFRMDFTAASNSFPGLCVIQTTGTRDFKLILSDNSGYTNAINFIKDDGGTRTLTNVFTADLNRKWVRFTIVFDGTDIEADSSYTTYFNNNPTLFETRGGLGSSDNVTKLGNYGTYSPEPFVGQIALIAVYDHAPTTAIHEDPFAPFRSISSLPQGMPPEGPPEYDMNDLYIDAQNGSDANDGTESSPKQTLAALDTFLTANPTDRTVHLAGTFTQETWDLPALTSCTIKQWSGKTQALLRADAEVPGPWVSAAGSEWAYTFPSNEEPVSITRIYENWETRKDSQGANLGALSALGLISGAGSLLANEFDYDAGTRLMTIRLDDDGDPNELTVTFIPAGDDSIDAPTFAGLVTTLKISGIHFWLYGSIRDDSEADVVGMGLRFIKGVAGLIIENCEFRDNGDAHIGFNGDVNFDDIVISTCRWYGGSHQGGAVNVVMDGVNMSNLTISDFTILGYPTLDRNGIRPTDIPVGINKEHRVFWLIADAANTLLNIDIKDGYVDCYKISSFIRTENWNASAATGDLEDFSTYPIRVHNVRVVNARTIMQPVTLGGSVAYRRCYLDARYMKDTDVLFSFAMTGILATRGYIYLESCVLIGDTTNADASGSLISLAAACKTYLVNTTLYNTSTSVDPEDHAIVGWADSLVEMVKAIQCVFAMSTPNSIFRVNAASTVAVVNLNMTDCWYYGYDPTAMTDEADLNTVSEWQASIDANGIYGDDPGFSNAPADLFGSPQSLLISKTKRVTGAASVGILGNSKTDRYGPYQVSPSGSGYAAMGYYGLVEPSLL